MPKLTNQLPKYRKHRPSGRAVVTIHGRDHYLGPWKSVASKTEYDRLIAEYLASGRQSRIGEAATITELLNAYRVHCESTYQPAHGGPNKVALNIRDACKPLRELFGETVASDFGPLKLQALIAAYVQRGWGRQNINRQIARVKAFFKWAVSNEFIPPSVYQALSTVGGLRYGRTAAKESDPVRPVAENEVAAIERYVSRQVWTMVQLQLLTGMRPGEVVIMRGCDIDTTGDVWTFRPFYHKTQHHGIARTVYLGPAAQATLKPWLRTDLQAFLFSPAEAEAERRQKLHDQRKTPLSCGNRPGTNKRNKPSRVPKDHYSRESYTRAIYTACAIAFPYQQPVAVQCSNLENERAAQAKWRKEHYWSPNRLRHTAATRIRKEFGAEASQTILGHRNLRTSEIYAERDTDSAIRIMSKIG